MNAAPTLARLERLVAAHSNVTYHGAYTNAELPSLLERFSVTLAPYVASSPLTRYIDPLRYYHCLNSGMEVITTDIPAGRALENYLHIVERPDDLGVLLDRMQREPGARRNLSSTAEIFNWRVKARRLIGIANSHSNKWASRNA